MYEEDAPLVEQLLAGGIDVDVVGGETATSPLHVAVDKENMPIVTMLLDAKASVDARDCYEQTPLHYAAIIDNDDFTRELLRRGAVVSAQNNEGLQPFHFAARAGRRHNLQLLHDQGARVDCKTFAGDTALHFVSLLDALDALLLLGADASLPNNDGVTPLHCAAKCGKLDNVHALVVAPGVDVAALTGAGFSAYDMASMAMKVEVATFLQNFKGPGTAPAEALEGVLVRPKREKGDWTPFKRKPSTLNPKPLNP